MIDLQNGLGGGVVKWAGPSKSCGFFFVKAHVYFIFHFPFLCLQERAIPFHEIGSY